ncbi:beta-barrel assembly complex subunit BamF [Aestuariispira insulae]|uniref:Beta-barrel assembly complex subunit BamF n=2 Tax=Aestuariispira insulae TaxID=1461337 RepID=A0A3D9HGB9_9PROT|nr:beta-barrel assembly complex subunit BamF [Aestuariispira insulae]
MRKRIILSLLAAAGLLSACGGDAGSILGLEKKAPDEFTVVSRAPLSLPPDFGLRPPDPNAKRANETSVREEARALLIDQKQIKRREEQARKEFGGGELALLTRADALAADGAIRRIVDDENTRLAIESDTFVNDLLFWKDKGEPGTIIDASAESQRIQENSGLGKPVTEGDTPMIRRERDDTIFNGFEWPF